MGQGGWVTIERRAMRVGRPPRLRIVLIVRLRGALSRRAGRAVAGNPAKAIRRGQNIVHSAFKRRG